MSDKGSVRKEFERLLAGWAVEDPFYKEIFCSAAGRTVESSLRSKSPGRAAGIPFAEEAARILGLESDWKVKRGDSIAEGQEIGRFRGTVEQIIKFENLVIGLIGKPSGIATAADEAKRLAEGKIRLVAGGWKKHPFPMKDLVLDAVTAGGICQRIVEEPFVYLDKNYVRILGGIGSALKAVASFRRAKVIQLRGEFGEIAAEAREALLGGACVLMVDTGAWKDLEDVLDVVKREKRFERVRVAFSGGIKLKDIPLLVGKGADILDIGAAILDAPWLDLTYDVVSG